MQKNQTTTNAGPATQGQNIIRNEGALSLELQENERLRNLLKRVDCFLTGLHEDAVRVFGGPRHTHEPLGVMAIRDAARAALAKGGAM